MLGSAWGVSPKHWAQVALSQAFRDLSPAWLKALPVVLKTLAGTGRSQAAEGETQNGSSEIRTQDQSVKSRLASPENLVAEMVSAKLSQEKSQEPAQWNLIIAHP